MMDTTRLTRRTQLISPKNKEFISLAVADDETLHCDCDAQAAVGDRVAVELDPDRWALGVVTRVYRPQARSRYDVKFTGGAEHTLPRNWRVARVCAVERPER